MLLRKIGASFLVMLFVLLSLPNFLIYGLSKTYLSTDFYRREDVTKGVYDFAIDMTVSALRKDSEMFTGYFDRDELDDQIRKVFTQKIFSTVLTDFANQIDNYKKDPEKPLVISLKVLRENLLTVGNNLTYIIYQNLPTCSDADLLAAISSEKAPECVPKNIPYDQVVRPINENFETTIYNEIPEELSNIDQAVPIKALVNIEQYKNLSFLVLVVILALIVLMVYGKTSTILSYIATGFLLSGVLGYGFGYALGNLNNMASEQIGDERVFQFFQYILSFLVVDMQRMALMFAGVGVLLLVMRFVLKRTVEDKPNAI
jgi:hypothetical protein